MSNIGQPERATQRRVIALFRDELGYRYLGDWTDRDGNSNVEEGLLTAYLTRNGYTPEQISSVLYKLRTEANNHSRGLYGNNKEVYKLLRYGVPVKSEAGAVTETVHMINWQEPEKNDFAIAEEVTLRGNRERRPDLVLYVHGIAVAVLELKRSSVSIGDGIRQNCSNQRPEFNEWFFSTVQFIVAGNNSEGLRYGAIETEEKYFLSWKEDEADNSRFKLDKYLLKMCRKDRLIELMHDFVLFDGGVKKLLRVHQYFGVKAAQEHVRRRQSGICFRKTNRPAWKCLAATSTPTNSARRSRTRWCSTWSMRRGTLTSAWALKTGLMPGLRPKQEDSTIGKKTNSKSTGAPCRRYSAHARAWSGWSAT